MNDKWQKIDETKNRVRFLLQQFYVRFSIYIILAVKFAAALAVFLTTNHYFPYRAFLCRSIVVIAIALICSILPWGYLSFAAALWFLAQLSALSLEASAFCAVLFLTLAVIRYLALPGGAVVPAILPLLCFWKIPYAVPLLLGLAGELSGFLSAAGGMVIFYTVRFLAYNTAYFTAASETSMVQRLLYVVQHFLSDREMLIAVICFALTTLLVYFISHLPIDYAHLIAVCVGAVFNPVLMLICLRSAEITGQLGGMLWGSLLGLAAALLYDTFAYGLDYSRTEMVSFEDDDYCYYVKAVPKVKPPKGKG